MANWMAVLFYIGGAVAQFCLLVDKGVGGFNLVCSTLAWPVIAGFYSVIALAKVELL